MRLITSALCLALSLFTLYTALFGSMTPVLQRGIHLVIVGALIYLLYPSKSLGKISRFTDVVLSCSMIGAGAYLYYAYQTINERIGFLDQWDLLFGSAFVLLLMEGCRRVVGWALTLIAGAFLLYAFFGSVVPGFFGHGGYSIERMVTTMYLTTEGVFGPAAAAAATFVAVFIMFGTFLEKTGASQVFVDLATAIGGKRRGGPAKVAVFASALTGSINGSPVANVTTTGIFTIPLMKKVGYKPHVSGAVEAVASSGGALLPPIMGVGAFVMSEMAGLAYADIIVAATIPAFLYFLSIFCVVDFEAAKNRLEGLPADHLPNLRETLKKGVILLIPLFVLVYCMVFVKVSVTRSALIAMLSIFLIGLVYPAARLGFKQLFEILEMSAKRMLLVSAACGVAGIVVGVITLSGLGLKLSGVLMDLGESSMFLSLLLVMLGTIVIGMGLPPTPAYIVFSVLSVPALLKLDVSLLAAHLFVFYYACFAPITPPVSLAAYTASAISDSKPLQTALTAFRFALPAFMIPFMFVYGPELLLEGPLVEILSSALTASIGVVFFAAVTVGWLGVSLRIHERMLAACGSVTLIIPGLMSDAIGIIILALTSLMMFVRCRKNGAVSLNSDT